MRSPNDAELMLEYEARGICGVRIREADEDSVQEAFGTVIKVVASEAGAEFTSAPVETRQVGGVRTTYRAYSFPRDGRRAHLALTTAERPIGAQQHLMTFGFVK